LADHPVKYLRNRSIFVKINAMKKILILVTLTGILFSAAAQVSFKPAIGLNFTDFSKNPSGEVKAQVGYQLGGSVVLGKKTYFEPGLFYIKKSSQYISTLSSNTQVDFDLSGVRIPLTVGVHLIGDNKSTVAVRAYGGVSAFLLASIKDLNKNDFNKASWGAYIGAGADLSIFFVEASYEWSVTNIQKDITAIDYGKSRSLFLNAGIKLKL